MLWGNNAKEKIKVITNHYHKILTAAHPSPLSANRGFFGCGHFETANRMLTERVNTDKIGNLRTFKRDRNGCFGDNR